MKGNGFWKEFASESNAIVNSATVVVAFIAIPTLVLALSIIAHHYFIRGKGLDGEVVKLFGILLGGGALGGGAISYFRKTVTDITSVGAPGDPAPTAAKAPKMGG